MNAIPHKPALLALCSLTCFTHLTSALYEVLGVGSFSQLRNYTFDGTTDNFAGSDNLFMSDYSQNDKGEVATATHDHNYDPANIFVQAPYVYLRVRGQEMDNPSNISCAEMTTDESQILYASVRTVCFISS